jgi:hypothetical protein
MKRLGMTLVFVGSLAACNAVLAIDEARVDPTLEDAGSAVPPIADASTRDSAPDGSPVDPNVVGCATYCALMQKNCAGANAQYINEGSCMALCSAMDVGKPGDATGDSLACRQRYAAQAGTIETIFNCRNAGPLSEGQCGGMHCRAFCNYALKLCGPRAYTRVQDCMDTCKDLPYDATSAVSADQDKNTLNCRLYHLQAGFALPDQASVHCPHTSADSMTCKRPPAR